jgi:hypothetical protein
MDFFQVVLDVNLVVYLVYFHALGDQLMSYHRHSMSMINVQAHLIFCDLTLFLSLPVNSKVHKRIFGIHLVE